MEKIILESSAKLKQFTSIPWDAYSFGSRGASHAGLQSDAKIKTRKLVLDRHNWENDSRNETGYDGNISCAQRTSSNSKRVNITILSLKQTKFGNHSIKITHKIHANSAESPRFEGANKNKDFIKYNKKHVSKINQKKNQCTDSKSPMNMLSVVQFCLHEDLKETDIDIHDIVSKSKIIKSKRITDTKLHSNVPPKPRNIIQEKRKKSKKPNKN